MGKVIGLRGSSQAGKDTVADYLIQKYGWTGKLSFSRNLKNMVKSTFQLTEDQVNTQKGKKTKFKTPIEFSRFHLGLVTDWMSRTHSDYNIPQQNIEYVRGLVGTVLYSPREVLQFIGTDICRSLINSYHIDIVWKDSLREGNWIISDVRFPDEALMIKNDLRGDIILIDREEAKDGSINVNHLSETAMKDWNGDLDIILNHKDGLEFLFKEVDNFLERNNYKCLNVES